jgi:UDPglucose 6-dehydrogenase
MKICMVGTGYVGLVTGVGLAETGNDVVCADIDVSKIERLNRGESIISEPGLDELVARNVKEQRLRFSSDVAGSMANVDVIFIGVGTPPSSDGSADLSAVDAVARTAATAAPDNCVIVIKSTVPVGTNARIRKIIAEHGKRKLHVVSNPEFLKEGDAVNDFLRPDRIIVGADPDDNHAVDVMRRLYHPLTLSGERMVWMNPPSAELTKYVANTMLAMRISFMNEVAHLCELTGGDVNSVRIGVGADHRIGKHFLYSGPGYGGSCFPKDVQALVHTAKQLGVDLQLAAATDRVNREQKGVLFRKLQQHFGSALKGKKIAVWGIAFKPRTDDIREAPALDLIDSLLEAGAQIAAHDPEAASHARALYGDRIAIVDHAYDATNKADALVLVTEWRQYQNPDFARIKQQMAGNVLLDGRNIWSSYKLNQQGFVYRGIGVQSE